MDGLGKDILKDTSTGKWIILMIWEEKSTETIYFEENVTGHPVQLLQMDKA